MAKKNILDAVGNTPLVELPSLSPKPGVRIFAKLEGANPTGSLKDRIAKYMVEDAESTGKLTSSQIILEPTSGNTGISLAMVGRVKGYSVEVVIPENVSPERIQLLEAYGVKIHYSEGTKGTNGAILVAQSMMERDPHHYFMPYQYGNDANPRAHYETTGKEIVEELPQVTTFVAGLGTGGTLMGVGRRLREQNPRVKIVAATPNLGDVIQGLRSLEEGFIPPIVDLSLLDARLMIDSQEAFRYTKMLLDQEGIFAGVSSGSVIACALQFARRLEQEDIVCLLADGGWKYLSTGLWTQDYAQLRSHVEGRLWW